MSNTKPLIIVGMHRSGTTLLTNILEESSFWLGDEHEGNSEPQYVLDLNDKILAYLDANWCELHGFEANKLANNDALKELAAKFVDDFDKILNGPFSTQNDKWGWKEPRTTLLLPLWLHFYPEARVIHIIRNGIDVAGSLYSRESRYREKNLLKRLLINLKHNFKVHSNKKLMDVNYCFELWEKYIFYAEKWLSNHKGEKLEIKYEDLLSGDNKTIDNLKAFLNLTEIKQEFGEGMKIDSNRAYAFLSNPKLKNLYQEKADSKYMVKYGYNEIEV